MMELTQAKSSDLDYWRLLGFCHEIKVRNRYQERQAFWYMRDLNVLE